MPGSIVRWTLCAYLGLFLVAKLVGGVPTSPTVLLSTPWTHYLVTAVEAGVIGMLVFRRTLMHGALCAVMFFLAGALISIVGAHESCGCAGDALAIPRRVETMLACTGGVLACLLVYCLRANGRRPTVSSSS